MLALVVTVFCATTLISITTFVISNTAQKDIEGADDPQYGIVNEDGSYTFGEIDPESDEEAVTYFINNSLYTKYNTFRINSKESFYTFCASTRRLFYNGCNRDGLWPFTGKTVYLNCDLNMYGEQYATDYLDCSPFGIYYDMYRNLAVFGGTFDGQGHKISNIYREDFGSYGGAFCEILYGTIKNLEFENIETLVKYSAGNSVNGVVAAYTYSGSTIENCIVVDAKFTSNRYNTDCFTAGIAGINNGTIKNCLVDTIYMAGYDKSITQINPDGMQCYPFCVDNSSYKDESKGIVEGCILKGGIKIDNSILPTCHTDTKYLEAKPIKPSGTKGTDYGGTYQYCYSTPNNDDGLSCSSEGGTVDETGYAWYYGGSSYNSGWPCLRYFISDWQEVTFTVSPAGAGSVEPSSIKIPSDVTSFSDPSYSSTFEILGQQITAKPNSGYSFSDWKKNSLNSWTALFEKIPDELSFGDPKDESGNTIQASGEGTLAKLDENGVFYGEQFYKGTTIAISSNERILLDGHLKSSEETYTLRFYSSNTLIIDGYDYPIWEFIYDIVWPYPSEPIVDYKISKEQIIPILELQTCKINFEVDGIGFSSTYGTSWEVVRGEYLEYDNDSYEIWFGVTGSAIINYSSYSANCVGVFESFTIGDTVYDCSSIDTGNLMVEEDLTITFTVKTLYTLTFEEPLDSNIELDTDYYEYEVVNDTRVSVTLQEASQDSGYPGYNVLRFSFYDVYYNDFYVYYYFNPSDYGNVGYNVNGDITYLNLLDNISFNVNEDSTISFVAQSIYTITFNNASGTSGDTISPSTPNSFSVYHGTDITVTPADAEGKSGPFDLIYSFTDLSGNSCTVTYTITDKYILDEDDNPVTVSGGTTITPKVKANKFSVDFGGTGGTWGEWTSVAASAASSEGISFGTEIKYVVTESTVTLTMNGQQKVFTADTGHKIDNLKITINGVENFYYPGDSGTITIKGPVSFYVTATRWYKVTFLPINNTTQPTSNQIIEVKSGDTISVTGNESKTLTYSYNGKSVTYQANRFYRLLGTSVTPTDDNTEIRPTIEFYACKVTMGDIDASIGERTGYTGEFVVEFDTEVNVTTNGNVHTYTFSNGGPVVKYEVIDKYEIDDYGLVDGNKTATSFIFSDRNVKTKTISPTFRVKTYKLNVTTNVGAGIENYVIYHSSTLTYNADLSLTDSSKFDFTYNCLYNSKSKTEYKSSGYFLEYYKITEAGKTPVENYSENVSNQEITVSSDITIELYFVTFYTVTFETSIEGIKDFGNLSSYTNPINLRSGSKIIGTYSHYQAGKNVELKYQVTYNDGKVEKTEDIVKYTIEQYYRVTATNNVESLNKKTTITPTIQFYACKVTMTKTDNLNVADMASEDNYETKNDGIFVVEFGTIVTFIFSQENGIFTYTYTFTHEGSEVAKVTYTMENNQYAMQYVLNETNGDRLSLKNGLEGLLEGEEFKFEAGTTSKEISPEFGRKQYDGELA